MERKGFRFRVRERETDGHTDSQGVKERHRGSVLRGDLKASSLTTVRCIVFPFVS